MKILIIDDYKEKLDEISNYISKLNMSIEVAERFSYQSGLMEILQNEYDLILLDMSMPTYDIKGHENGGQKKPFAGREILRQMQRKNNCTPVIIITQFKSFGEGLKMISIKELSQELLQFVNFKGIVYYSSSNTSWELELQTLISQVNV